MPLKSKRNRNSNRKIPKTKCLKKENSQTANNTKTKKPKFFLAQKLKKPISKIIITAKPLMPPPIVSESNKT